MADRRRRERGVAQHGGTRARFDGFDRAQQIHLTVCGLTHLTAPPGVRLHRSTLLDTSSCVTVDGIRVVSKPVALIQIAGTRPRDFAGRALDGVLRDGVPAERLAEVAHQWHRRGVKGPPVVLQLINQRVQQRLPRSWFQRLAKRVLHGRGLRMVDEYPIDDPVTGRRIADLDLAIPSLKIGVECQSWEWHSTPTAQARDAARKRRLRVQLGWEIVELWWTDLTRIDGVVEEVQYLIDQRTRPTFGVLTS